MGDTVGLSMTVKPHDAIFKAAFEQPDHAAGLFRSLLPATVVRAIDWATLSREAGSFIDPDLADRQSDLLFAAEVRGGRALLYMLLEHQSTSDADMPLRMLVYLVRIWERHRKQNDGPLPPIIPVVVSHAPGGWTAARAFEDLFDPHPTSIPGLAELTPRFSLVVEDLAHVTNDDLKARALAAFPKLVLWALRDARNTEQLLANLGHWGAAFKEALRTPHGMEAVRLLMRYIALVSDDLHLDQFRAKIREQAPEAEEAAMTIAEQIRQEVHTTVLLKQLTLKFGGIADEHRARIEKATAAEVERYVERILAAETIDEVFA